MAVQVVAAQAANVFKVVKGLFGNKDKAKYENGNTAFEVNNYINDWTWPLWAPQGDEYNYNIMRWFGWRKFPAKDHMWKRKAVIDPSRVAFENGLLDINTFDLYGCLRGTTTVDAQIQKAGLTPEKSAGQAQAIMSNVSTALSSNSMLVMIGVIILGGAILLFTGKKG